jgi:RES domain-containing protein
MWLWRISNHADLSGSGGLRASGRWHSRGRPIVYCSEHPAAALLEALVHLEVGRLEELPDSYQLLEIEVPRDVKRRMLDAKLLSERWRESQEQTRAIGDAWLASARSALLGIPSAIVPRTTNFLLNPAHPHASRLSLVSVSRYPFDPRLFAVRSARRRIR